MKFIDGTNIVSGQKLPNGTWTGAIGRLTAGVSSDTDLRSTIWNTFSNSVRTLDLPVQSSVRTTDQHVQGADKTYLYMCTVHL